MEIQSAAYSDEEHTAILVTLKKEEEKEQQQFNVPSDPRNRHYRKLIEWTKEGNEIGVYVPDMTSVAEGLRQKEFEDEAADMAGASLEQRVDWVRDRLQETTLDAQSKIALGRVFKKIIAQIPYK